ncbi:MAG: diacylglycerol kinase family lipid kinase [Chlorobi bacterium]|nr:diacylglycerol kinase family lipid kinase [Chlorobiota bacterium]
MTDNPIKLIDKWIVLVNPHAGTGKGKKDWGKINEFLSRSAIEFEAFNTKHREHALALTTKFIKKGYRKFIVTGGDGTLNEVVNGIFIQKKIPTEEFLVAMIPVGTGNDWCRMFDIPFDYEKAIKIIQKGEVFQQDIGKVSFYQGDKQKQRFFINVAGMGYDAIVAAKTNKDKERGRGGLLVYLKNLLSSLLFYKFSDVKMLTNGEKEPCNCKAFSISVGICKYNGGGMMQLPNAVADDGLLDITLIKKIGRFSVIRQIKNLYDGSFINHPKVETFRAKTLKIESHPPIDLEVDGESLGHSPFQFRIIPQSLKVLVGNME